MEGGGAGWGWMGGVLSLAPADLVVVAVPVVVGVVLQFQFFLQ